MVERFSERVLQRLIKEVFRMVAMLYDNVLREGCCSFRDWCAVFAMGFKLLCINTNMMVAGLECI